MVAEAEAARGQTTINPKAAAIAAEMAVVAAETAAAMAVAAAMATAGGGKHSGNTAAIAAVMAAPTLAEAEADVGRRSSSVLVFAGQYRSDNNCMWCIGNTPMYSE